MNNGLIEDDDDGDVLNPFFTLSPPRPHRNFASSPPNDLLSTPNDAVPYSHPSLPRNFLDDDHDGDDDFGFTSVSQNSDGLPVFDRFDSSSSPFFDGNNQLYGSGADAHALQERPDHMMDDLDRKLSVDDVISSDRVVLSEQSEPLPEFTADGGGKGIFRLLLHSAVNPNRPPGLEFRPQPLRERQIGKFLRNIVCLDDGKQMWAGSECGLRAWDLVNMYDAGVGNGEVESDDDDDDDDDKEEEEGECEGSVEEDTVPYVESVMTVGTLCVVGDDANRVVWSGHKDGKIRCWKMDGIYDGRKRFTQGISWQAHRGPVLSMVMTSHGKI